MHPLHNFTTSVTCTVCGVKASGTPCVPCRKAIVAAEIATVQAEARNAITATYINGVRAHGPVARRPVTDGKVYRDGDGRPYGYATSGLFGCVSKKVWLD